MPEGKDHASAQAGTIGAETLSIRDALLVVAIRLIGSDIRRNPSARRHILALARSTPLLMDEDYGATEARLTQLVAWAGTARMDDLFTSALDLLREKGRREALRWAAENAAAQQQTDETTAMLYHIGKALGFAAAEVESSLAQAVERSSGATRTSRRQ
jgi:hypothetical protein